MQQPFTATARHTPPHSSAFVQMHSGFCVDLLAPDLTGLTLTDIATHLARLPRFNGATRGPRPYSVAQHSVLVSQILEQAQHNRLIQIAGLLHDAHEALMGDITTPTKIALGRAVVLALEQRLQGAIAARFGLSPMLFAHYGVAQADHVALATERRDLMASSAWPWASNGAVPLADTILQPWAESHAHVNFLSRASRLGLR